MDSARLVMPERALYRLKNESLEKREKGRQGFLRKGGWTRTRGKS